MSSFRITTGLALLSSFVLCGCFAFDEKLTQTISGRLVANGPSMLGEVKALSKRDDNCESEGVTSVVDERGQFSLRRTVTRGRLAVIVQHDLICYKKSGDWEVVWRSRPHGPAAESLAVDCVKFSPSWKCKIVTNWGVDIARAR